MKINPLTKIKLAGHVEKAKKKLTAAVEFASEVADVVTQEKIGKAVLAKGGLRILNSLVKNEILISSSESLFEHAPYLNVPEMLKFHCIKTIKFHGKHLLEVKTTDGVFEVFELRGHHYVIHESPYDDTELRILVEDWENLPQEEVREIKKTVMRSLAQLCWELLGTSIELGTPNFNKSRHVSQHVLQRQSSDQTLPSKTSRDIYTKHIKPFWESNVNRSLLLYGEPGTGKSCAIRYIISELKGVLCLTLSVASITSLDNSSAIIGMVRFLRPDVLVIDDMDRLSGKESLLYTLEESCKVVRLFMASANDIRKLPRALIRPGRLDTLVKFDRLSPEVFDHLTRHIRRDSVLLEKVHNWPVAYLNELNNRAEANGGIVRERDLKDLLLRLSLDTPV